MSEYPDKVLLDALNDVSGRGSRWLVGPLKKCAKKRKLGDLTMVFSMEDGGIPIFSSVYVPWMMVWESLAARMRRGCRIVVGKDNPIFASDENGSGIPPQKGLCLQDLDEAIDALTDDRGSRRPIVSVECCPCLPYTIQLIVCYGGLTVMVKTRRLDLGLRYEMAWTLTEAAMLGHYCAARLGVPADRVVFTGYDCFLSRGATLGRKAIGMTAYIRQPRLCFGRVAKSCKECFPGDVFVSGYMRVSKSVCDIRGAYATSAATIKRAMSVGGLAAFEKWRVGFGAPVTAGDGHVKKSAYF